MIGQAHQRGQVEDVLNLLLLHFERQLRCQRRGPVRAREIYRNDRFSILPIQRPLNDWPFFRERGNELQLLFRVSSVTMKRQPSSVPTGAVWASPNT
jgi:hypothetical protein